MPAHHPDDEWLTAFAAGTLPEAERLILAAHLSMCGQCCDRDASNQAVGGAMLDDMAPVALSDSALDDLLERLGDEPVPPPAARNSDARVPSALQELLPAPLDELRWKTRFGVSEVDLGVGADGSRSFLIKLPAGATVPRHTHRGQELTLVLTGAFTDCLGTFKPGDFMALDSDHHHQPTVRDDQDCICLAVTTAPLKLTGTLGRLLNPFLR